MAKESFLPKDWFKKAQIDLKSSEILLSSGELETAAFHIQQAVEKYLKGYLLSEGWRLKRTHDLVELLNTAVGYGPSLESFREFCMVATEYYTEERYPFMITSKLKKAEIKLMLEKIKKLIKEIKLLLKKY